MGLTVGVAEAHNRLSGLIDQAVGGEEIVIARRGVPIARLVPWDAQTRSQARTSDGESLADALTRRLDGRRRLVQDSEDDLAAHIARERSDWG
jgi:prevent-host-death family protein